MFGLDHSMPYRVQPYYAPVRPRFCAPLPRTEYVGEEDVVLAVARGCELMPATRGLHATDGGNKDDATRHPPPATRHPPPSGW